MKLEWKEKSNEKRERERGEMKIVMVWWLVAAYELRVRVRVIAKKIFIIYIRSLIKI